MNVINLEKVTEMIKKRSHLPMAPSCCKHLIQILRYLFSIGCTQPFTHHLLARRTAVQVEICLEAHPDLLQLIAFDSFHMSTPLSFFDYL